MNILIVNGSAKRGGECEKLIDIFNEGTGASVISVFFENISPCVDCGCCEKTGECVIKDDMTKYYSALRDADLIVLASPIYFSSLTGIMMNFLSRLQVFYLNGDIIKNEKKALLLLTGGGSTKKLDIAERQAKIALTAVKGRLIETIAFTETDKMSVADSEEVREKIRSFKEKYL
ncbi:MAG: NAD(P)H-dependent oxidoreductase [Clostridiales bacterium]|nr:NAD(P)H-dependent oxidoreductase [Clostridiales bacterium]